MPTDDQNTQMPGTVPMTDPSAPAVPATKMPAPGSAINAQVGQPTVDQPMMSDASTTPAPMGAEPMPQTPPASTPAMGTTPAGMGAGSMQTPPDLTGTMTPPDEQGDQAA